MNITTSYSNLNTLVLQITPDIKAGNATMFGLEYQRTAAWIIIPETNSRYIHCPLNYFQESASLPGKWILNDINNRITFDSTSNLNKVIITEFKNGVEQLISIPANFNTRLFDYFKFDICHNLYAYKGFDCYAFICLITNVKYFPQNPYFTYEDKEPDIGDAVVLTQNNALPESIMHWALYLGNDYYLSKFGESGKGASSLLTVMDLKGMCFLYKCNKVFVAKPKPNAKHWDGYTPY